MQSLRRKRKLAAIRQARYRAKHRERINCLRRMRYDPTARHERHIDTYRPKRAKSAPRR